MSSGSANSRSVTPLMLCVLLIGLSSPGRAAVPATTPAYNVADPVYPVIYTDSDKQSQRDAARQVIRQINATIAGGGEHYTVLPGIYRVPASGPDSQIKFVNDKPFRLTLANTEFILENGGNFLSPPRCESLTIAGPVKFDADPLAFSQATVLAHDEITGVTRLRIMPGYKVDIAPKGTIDAFTSAGVPLPNPSWAEYTHAGVINAKEGVVELKTSTKTDFRGLYSAGNLVAMRSGNPVLLSIRDLKHLAVKDAEVFTGVGFARGGGSGDWSFTNIRGIRRPGTNRLYGVGRCQVGNYGGDVIFDNCEFSNNADDLMDYFGDGLSMIVRRESPRSLIVWGGMPTAGDGLILYDHTDFHPIGSSKIVTVESLRNPSLQSEAQRLVVEVLKARTVGEKPIFRLTFDRDLNGSVANFVENATARRPNHFTCRNCYFHDSGVRVLVQGFQHGLFENNRFERISGGLALTCDAWLWEGPTCQDITVRNNVFIDTTYRNGWGTGKAALIVGPTTAPTDPTLGVAFHGVSITGNRFFGSSTGAILVSNAADVTIKDNVIERPFSLGLPQAAIHVRAVLDCQMSGNTIINCPGAGIFLEHVNHLILKGNNFQDVYRGIGTVFKNVPSSVIGLFGCNTAFLQGNWVTGSDAAQAIWVEQSTAVRLQGNRGSKLAAPGAVLMKSGSDNVDVKNDDGGN